MLKKTNKKESKLDKKEKVKEEKIEEKEKPVRKKVEVTNTLLDSIKATFKELSPDAEDGGFGYNFFKNDIFDVSQEDQNEYFNMLKNIFTDLNIKKPRMSVDEYASAYYKLLESVTEMAVCGCVPAMDYLCFIYKKGVDDVMPINLTRAHEWGLLATACGSKLSPERLRLFLDTVYKYVTDNDLVDAIMDKYYAETDDDLINYIAYSFANVFNEKYGLSLGVMSKKKIIQTESFQVFLKNTSKIVKDCLPIMAKYIA